MQMDISTAGQLASYQPSASRWPPILFSFGRPVWIGCSCHGRIQGKRSGVQPPIDWPIRSRRTGHVTLQGRSASLIDSWAERREEKGSAGEGTGARNGPFPQGKQTRRRRAKNRRSEGVPPMGAVAMLANRQRVREVSSNSAMIWHAANECQTFAWVTAASAAWPHPTSTDRPSSFSYRRRTRHKTTISGRRVLNEETSAVRTATSVAFQPCHRPQTCVILSHKQSRFRIS